MKQSTRWLCTLVGLMLFCCHMMAMASPTDSQRLADLLAQSQTLQANFEQKTFSAKGGKVLQENKGVMIFKRPDFFRWSVESPIQQLIVSNGKTLWVYDIDLEQVSKQMIGKGEQTKPAMVLLSDSKILDENFTVRAFKDEQPGEWFELKPKSPDTTYQIIALYFERQQLRQLQFKDTAGQLSHIVFRQAKMNLKVSEKNFEFTPPPGVDVVGMD